MTNRLTNELQVAVNGFINDLDCSNKAESTIKAYRSDLQQFKVFLNLRYQALLDNLAGLKTCHVIQYKEYLLREKGFARRTVDRKYFAFRKFCKYLKMAGFLETNPVLEVNHTKYVPGTEPNGLIWDEVYLIIDMAVLFGKANTMRDVAILSVLAYTGCRRSDALLLQWKDINFREGTISIYRKKTKSYDYLPMHPKLMDALKQYYAEHRFQPKGPLFLSKKGKRLSVTAMKKVLEKYVKYSGIQKDFSITPHTFRHSFITNNVKAGVSLPEIQAYTGHSDLESLKAYVHFSIEDKKNLISKIPA